MCSQNLYPGTSRIETDEDVNYEATRSGLFSKQADMSLQLRIDIDKPRPTTKPTNYVSGSLTARIRSKPLWSGKASAAYFRSGPRGVKVDNDMLQADIYVTLSDGGKRLGHVEIKLKGSLCDVKINIESGSANFVNVERKSLFYKELTLDIDYVEEDILKKIGVEKPGMYQAGQTGVDVFSAFAAAGIKLHYDPKNSQKVEDPTPDTRWTKADMYAVMEDYFDHAKETDESVWCLAAERPPDPRFMGYSFSNEGKNGFGIFNKHPSFDGMDSADPLVKERASRRFLHILVHECAHCLGLMHPFDNGNLDSLSWMNYAWKYDSINGKGKFYERFKYSFSDEELVFLRHQPDKVFKVLYLRESGTPFQFSSAIKSFPPDIDSEDEDEEDFIIGNKTSTTPPLRKVSFKIKFRSEPFQKDEIVEFKGTLRNVGKLECKIEPDLSIGEGNVTLYVTDPAGNVQTVQPFVRGIETPSRRYIILGKPGSLEYSEVYSEMVPIVETTQGALFKLAGTYHVKAVYQSGKIKATTESVPVTIVNGDNDEKTNKQVRIAASLDGYAPDVSVGEKWDKLVSQSTRKKMEQLSTILALMKGLSKNVIKVIKGRPSSKARQRVKKLERRAGLKSAKELIDSTTDLVNFAEKEYNANVVDAEQYSKLVMIRAALFYEIGEIQTATMEYNQMIANLLSNVSDFGFIIRLTNEWKNLQNSNEPSAQASDYQARVDKLIFWKPTDVAKGEKDESGVGLGMPFNNFDDDQVQLGFKFAEDLDRIEEDTDDLDAVLNHAEGVLYSQEVNHQVYQWAIETYVVHSKLAKKYKVRYPDPPQRDPSMLATAAIVETKREGKPVEQWLNYWRNDGDFNHHHRHWHAVYRGVYRFSKENRQGELFGYMHAQMLARYDAERESWGLPPVVPYDMDEMEPFGFDAGWEFHEDFTSFKPRPPKETWDKRLQELMQGHKKRILDCFEKGYIEADGEKQMIDFNIAGHIVEASSQQWKELGSLHNTGHMAFCQTKHFQAGENRHATTYMGSTLSAVRDPIFFRWHKHVDNVIQVWNDSQKQDIGADAPGVIIEPTDVLILPGTVPPADFDKWVSYSETSGNWEKNDFKSKEIKTYLRKPALKYEWDNKLDHEEFSYHIRIKRKPETKGELRLTLRLFICQERHINNRRRWIEMDKFIIKMKETENYKVLRRKDKHSSVIKRLHMEEEAKELFPAFEGSSLTEEEFSDGEFTIHPGNCECGWPYNMMLPRGVKEGEKWVLGLFISDSKAENFKDDTACGSMSYCGTRDKKYPDPRPMGYPFCSKISIKNKQVSISEAAEQLTNFCISPFVINNDFEIKNPATKPSSGKFVWTPFGSIEESAPEKYNDSRMRGRFRVLLDDKYFHKMGADRMRVRFQGRESSSYAIKDVKLALRKGQSLDVDPECNVEVKFNNSPKAEVHEEGLISDEFVLTKKTSLDNDYFLTFTLLSPGCFMKAPQKYKGLVSTYFTRHVDDNDNWGHFPRVITLTSLYCVDCLF